LFAAETGKTFAAYVRGRRLTEAVKELLSGAPDILSVAIGAAVTDRSACGSMSADDAAGNRSIATRRNPGD
jgi:AraC-like DNA-binding protein